MKNILCFLGFHKWKVLWSGYPKYSRWFYEIEQCKRCGIKRRTKDNLFMPPRNVKYIHKELRVK